MNGSNDLERAVFASLDEGPCTISVLVERMAERGISHRPAVLLSILQQLGDAKRVRCEKNAKLGIVWSMRDDVEEPLAVAAPAQEAQPPKPKQVRRKRSDGIIRPFIPAQPEISVTVTNPGELWIQSIAGPDDAEGTLISIPFDCVPELLRAIRELTE